jgi:Na+/proline symporter
LEVFCHPWTVVQVSTAQEEHGGGKRLIRIRYRLRTERYAKVLLALFVLGGIFGVGLLTQSAMVAATSCFAACGMLGLTLAWLWWHGTSRAALAVGMVDALARDLNLIPLPEASAKELIPISVYSTSAKELPLLSLRAPADADGPVKESTA